MINLIKAEWFKFRKTKLRFNVIFSVVCICLILFAYKADEISGIDALPAFSSWISESVFLSAGVLLTSLSMNHKNRTALYTTVSGYSPLETLFAHAILYSSILIIIYVIPQALVFAFLGKIDVLYILLFVIFSIRITLITVFLSPLLKRKTVVFIVILLIIEYVFVNTMLIKPVISDTGVINSATRPYSTSFASYIFTVTQAFALSNPLPDALLAKIIVSSFVTCILAFVIGYLVMKHKYNLESKAS